MQLEYASEIWNPNTQPLGYIVLNNFQRNSARFVFANYNKRDHVTLIQKLNWDSLHTCRLIQQGTML